jgi:adenylate cyclase
MSGDPAQEYFSDGLTEEIITAISKVPALFVIARNSTFTYKGKPVKVKQVSEALGVKYVLEGSVRKSGDKVRVTAQLIDAIRGHHLWAERYERDLKDLFTLQDELTLKIVRSLFEHGLYHLPLIKRKTTHKLQAYLKWLKGSFLLVSGNKESNALARGMFKEAIAIDRDYPLPYEGLAWTHLMDVWLGSSKSPKQSIGYAFKLAKKAIDMDDSVATRSHILLCNLYTLKRQYDKAIPEGERAIELNPNSNLAYDQLAHCLNFSGRPKDAITLCEKAIRLNPICVSGYFPLAIAYRDSGRYKEAIAACNKVLNLRPNHINARTCLTSCYSLSGREKEARVEALKVLRINRNFSLDFIAKTIPYKNQVHLKFVIDSLRKAGLK